MYKPAETQGMAIKKQLVEIKAQKLTRNAHRKGNC